jgi:hypothetical protein
VQWVFFKVIRYHCIFIPDMKSIYLKVWIVVISTIPLFCPSMLYAQDYEDDRGKSLDTANAFCKRLSKIMLQTDRDFADAKDVQLDSTGQKAWDCREDYKMPGSHNCTIFSNGNKTTYVSYYLSRASKEDLAPSYKNLYHQLKDCLGYKYVYTEKKTTAADRFIGNNVYECEMEPYGDGIKEQADMRISIQRMPEGNYELIMEIMKYTGKYSNRPDTYNDGK